MLKLKPVIQISIYYFGNSIDFIVIKCCRSAILNSNCLERILAERFSRKLDAGRCNFLFLEHGTVVKTLEKQSKQVLPARTDGALTYQGTFILHSLESHVPSESNKTLWALTCIDLLCRPNKQ